MEDSIAIYFPVNYVKFPKEDILPNNFDLMLLNSPLQSKKFCKCEFTVFFFLFISWDFRLNIYQNGISGTVEYQVARKSFNLTFKCGLTEIENELVQKICSRIRG